MRSRLISRGSKVSKERLRRDVGVLSLTTAATRALIYAYIYEQKLISSRSFRGNVFGHLVASPKFIGLASADCTHCERYGFIAQARNDERSHLQRRTSVLL